MIQTSWKGVVKGKKVMLGKDAKFPDGTEVLVTPLAAAQGTPQAVLAAIDAPPHLKPHDVEEFQRMIAESKRPVRFTDPLARKR